MYVRKFEADTIEMALKQIKQELGPDAVILKTVTNKGLKGAFKKNKIEITAAVSEKNYLKKSHVDSVLQDKKEEFYTSSSAYLSNMIDTYADNNSKVNVVTTPSYGKMALNKTVKTSQSSSLESLDSFLSETKSAPKLETSGGKEGTTDVDREVSKQEQQAFLGMANTPIARSHPNLDVSKSPNIKDDEQQVLRGFEEKFNSLEKKIFELYKKMDKFEDKGPEGLINLKVLLKTFDINTSYIQKLVKELIAELSFEQLQESDLVFEMALKKMANFAKTKVPHFSSDETNKTGSITILLSEASVGQTTMMLKMATLMNNPLMIEHQHYPHDANSNKSMFVEKILDLTVKRTNTIPEIITNCREGISANRPVVVDYRNSNHDVDEIKKFIDGIKRTFLQVEVFICISAIHGELYNRKVINTFSPFADGIIVSHLDLCLNYGTLFNLFTYDKPLPFVFYGTGKRVPDDIEPASVERLLSGVFQLV